MSLPRRAIERPRVTTVIAVSVVVALVGAGLIGATIAGDVSDDADARVAAAEAEAREAERQADELRLQLEAALRRIEDFRAEAESMRARPRRGDEGRRGQASSRPRERSRAGSRRAGRRP